MSYSYSINFTLLFPYWPVYVSGTVTTLAVSALAVAFAFPLGLLGALCRVSPRRLVRWPAAAYVEVLRNVPFLVVLYIVFFALPAIGLVIDPFIAAVVTMSLNGSAFVVEIFRGGFAAIPPAQTQAGLSLGMGRYQVFRYVVFPQVVAVAFPALGNQVTSIVIGSSVCSVIGVQEVTYQILVVGASTFRYFEVFTLAAVMYLIATQLIMLGWNAVGRLVVRGTPVPIRQRRRLIWEALTSR
jgi:polar amino acid transport system permease protein